MRLRITTPEIKFIDHASANNVAIGFEMAKHTMGEKFSKNLIFLFKLSCFGSSFFKFCRLSLERVANKSYGHFFLCGDSEPREMF